MIAEKLSRRRFSKKALAITMAGQCYKSAVGHFMEARFSVAFFEARPAFLSRCRQKARFSGAESPLFWCSRENEEPAAAHK
jgi:hypothetical protein